MDGSDVQPDPALASSDYSSSSWRVSNCCYIVFNFLNLNAGWIHRIDNPHVKRPWRAPNWLLAVGIVLAFVNAFLLGAGADVWGQGTLISGIVAIALIIPVFVFRHFVQDKGKFPPNMLADLSPDGKTLAAPKAGMLPYLTLAAGILTALVGYVIFWT